MYVHKKTSHLYIIFFVVAVFCFLFGWQANELIFTNSDDDISKRIFVSDVQDKNGVNLDLFWTVWEEIEENYVHEEQIDYEIMVYGAIKGMVNSLNDPYTVFMTPDESEDFNSSLEGTFEGIGAELTVEDKNLIIVSPLRNSPAEKAGLLPGDIIYMIDGNLAYDMTLFEAIMNIRGEKGTPVTLTILREGLEDPFDVEIIRDSIDLESITIENLENEIVYLSVNQFNDKTTDEFNKAISEMILHEPDGVIIDLRFNGGGYLDIAVDMLSYLLPADTPAVMIQERGEDDEIMYTDGNPKLLNVPLVILVNEGSASASEIVAGAIQDHNRGIVMGTQTFGKGTVQEVEYFSDNSSLRITIAKWLTPDGRDIDDQGLTPDISVEFTDKDFEEKTDIQKQRAIEYLENLDS